MRRLYQFLAGILAIIFFLWGISAYMQSRTGNVSDKLVKAWCISVACT